MWCCPLPIYISSIKFEIWLHYWSYSRHSDKSGYCSLFIQFYKLLWLWYLVDFFLNWRFYYNAVEQWFLNLMEVPNPSSFMRAFTEPFDEIQNISANKLEPKVNYASVARKILLFKERKRTKHEFHRKTQLNKYLLQIDAFCAEAFQKQSQKCVA